MGYSPQGHRASDITFTSLLPLNYASFTEGASLENQSSSSHFDNNTVSKCLFSVHEQVLMLEPVGYHFAKARAHRKVVFL